MPNPDAVALIGTCPHCGESVEMIITKRQAKILFKYFKLQIQHAQLFGEKQLEVELKKCKK